MVSAGRPVSAGLRLLRQALLLLLLQGITSSWVLAVLLLQSGLHSVTHAPPHHVHTGIVVVLEEVLTTCLIVLVTTVLVSGRQHCSTQSPTGNQLCSSQRRRQQRLCTYTGPRRVSVLRWDKAMVGPITGSSMWCSRLQERSNR